MKKKTGPKPKDPAERFWSHVNKLGGNGCFIWTGSKCAAGYGRFGVTRASPVLAHRFAWEMSNGQIPDGMHVLHKCDNASCVNAEHLFIGTNSDNIRDRVTKGRSASGENHWTAKNPDRVKRGEEKSRRLNDESVVEILIRLSNKETHKHIAETYKISRSMVWKISRGKAWSHIKL